MLRSTTPKTLLLLLVFTFFTCSLANAQGDKPYYKAFVNNTYEPYIDHNDMLGDQIGLRNITTKRTVLKASFDDIVSINGKYVRVIKDDLWGIVDTFGKVIIPIKYKLCSDLDQGRAFVCNSSDRLALANSNGELLTKFIYEDFSPFYDGVGAGVKQNGKWGFINKQGVMVIPFKYDVIHEPRGGKISVITKSYETYILGTVQEMDKPWTRRPNDVTIKNENRYIIDYQGRTIFSSNDEIVVLKDGSFVTVSKSKDCSLENENWVAFELYDKSMKKLINYKACWTMIPLNDYMIIKNGATGKYGISYLTSSDIVKTPYADYNLIKDSAGNDYIKFSISETEFLVIDLLGNCVEMEGSKCE